MSFSIRNPDQWGFGCGPGQGAAALEKFWGFGLNTLLVAGSAGCDNSASR
jgi:hypothetical protein